MSMSFALGEFPLGGFPLTDSLSVGDPLVGLITLPHARREFLLRAEPKDSIGVGNPFDVSGDGYVSHSTDTPFKHFWPSIQRPGDFKVSLPIPALHGSTQTGIGASVLNNPDGLVDTFLDYDWLGIDVGVYLGPKDGALTEFTEILRGPSAGVTKRLDDAAVLFHDAKFKLQKSLQPRKYWGMGAALRFDGSGDWVSYGDILNQGASDSFTVEVLLRSSSLATIKTLAAKKNAAGTAAGWALYYDASNQLICRIGDGVNTVVALVPGATGASYLDGKLRRVSAVVDRVAQAPLPYPAIRIYVDGELIITSASIAAVGSLSNAVTFYTGRFSDGGGGHIGDLDDFRFWSIARTQSDIQSDMHRELVGNEANLEIYTKYNEGSGATADDSTVNNRDGTITGATWIGSLEGDSTVAGRPKPLAFGVRRQVAPVWVDTQNLVAQFHDGSMQAVTAMRDSGDPITFGSDLADIYSATPAAGTYNTSLVTGLVRFGSEPVGSITGDIQGDNSGTLGYLATAPGIGRKILVQFGEVDNSTGFDEAAITALTTADSSVVGLYFDQEINIDQAVAESFSSIWSWWGMGRTGVVTCGRIADPATLTPTVTFDSTNLVDPSEGGRFESNQLSVRVGEVRVMYRPYHTTLGDNEVAGVVDLATRNDYGEKYRVASAIDPDRSPDADVIELFTSLDELPDAQALADLILAIMMVDRKILNVTPEGGLLTYFIGTVVSVTLPRYDYSVSKNFIVVDLSEFYGDNTSPDRVEVGLFG